MISQVNYTIKSVSSTQAEKILEEVEKISSSSEYLVRYIKNILVKSIDHSWILIKLSLCKIYCKFNDNMVK